MKFNIPSSKEKKSEYFLGLDVGTEAVKSIIFQRILPEKADFKKIIIWGRGLEYFDKSNVFDSQEFAENSIKNAISESIKGAYQNFLKNLGRKVNFQLQNLPMLVNLSSSILKEKVIAQSLRRENGNIIISKKEEGDIYKSVFKNIQSEIEKNFSQKFGILPEDIQFFSFKILELKIDGYNVFRLEGFRGKNLDFKIIVTFAFREYLKNIGKILKDLKLNFFKFFHKEQNIHYFFNYEGDEMVFLDVGGEISQFFLIKKGKITGIFDFESGGLDFTDRLSKVLGLNLEDARNLKHNYSDRLLSEEVREKIREILFEEIRNWFSNFKRTIRAILEEQKILFPSQIFIFGGGSSLPEIQEILEEGNWEELPFVSKPKVELIYPKDFKNVEDRTMGLISTQDVNLILTCLSPSKENSFIFDK